MLCPLFVQVSSLVVNFFGFHIPKYVRKNGVICPSLLDMRLGFGLCRDVQSGGEVAGDPNLSSRSDWLIEFCLFNFRQHCSSCPLLRLLKRASDKKATELSERFNQKRSRIN